MIDSKGFIIPYYRQLYRKACIQISEFRLEEFVDGLFLLTDNDDVLSIFFGAADEDLTEADLDLVSFFVSEQIDLTISVS